MRPYFTNIVCCIFLLVSKVFQAQPAFYEKIYGTAAADQSMSVKQLSDGSIYVAGYSDVLSPGSFDATLSKLDVYGNLLWTKYYDGGGDDFVFQLITLPDNSLVMAGSRRIPGGSTDALAIRTDTSGMVLYQATFGSPSQDEAFAYISPDGYGDLVACGYAATTSAMNDVYVVKMNVSCGQIWAKTYGGPDIDYGQRILPASDGGYVFSADSRSFGGGTYDIWLSGIDTAGSNVWNFYSIDTVQNGCQGFIVTQDGNYVIFGETEIYPGSSFNFSLEKVSATGTGLWKKNFGDPTAKDALFEIIEQPDKSFICTGYSNEYNHAGTLDLVILHADSTGAVAWAENYGGDGTEIGYDLVPSVNGGYLVTGKTNVLTDDEYYLLSLDALGLLTHIPEDDPAENRPLIFPNPSAGAFDIRTGGSSGTTLVKIFSLSGQLLYTESATPAGDRLHIDLRKALPAGCYFVQTGERTSCKAWQLLMIR
jgi:hypothetical protein